jgi:hypothetical protein
MNSSLRPLKRSRPELRKKCGVNLIRLTGTELDNPWLPLHNPRVLRVPPFISDLADSLVRYPHAAPHSSIAFYSYVVTVFVSGQAGSTRLAVLRTVGRWGLCYLRLIYGSLAIIDYRLSLVPITPLWENHNACGE